MSRQIIYKTPQQINNIRESGKYLTELLTLVRDSSREGVTLNQLETIAERFLKTYNLKGAFKGYDGFPTNLCLSVNECVVHGAPDETVLKKGDLLKIDAWVDYKGGISDAAISMVIWGDETNPQAAHLAKTTKGALDEGMKYVGPGKSLLGYGEAVYEYITTNNCSIIKNLTGHGVGVHVHEGPAIYNWPNVAAQQYSFEPNMVVALEPITAIRSNRYVEQKGVERNLYTEHNDLGAQREYTVLITQDWYEILAGIQ